MQLGMAKQKLQEMYLDFVKFLFGGMRRGTKWIKNIHVDLWHGTTIEKQFSIENLLNVEMDGEVLETEMDAILLVLSTRLNSANVATIDTPPSCVEIYDALLSIKGDSCPGLDGLGKVFYELFWDVIKEDLIKGLLKYGIVVGCRKASHKA